MRRDGCSRFLVSGLTQRECDTSYMMPIVYRCETFSSPEPLGLICMGTRMTGRWIAYKQRRFWATHVNRKWTLFSFNKLCLHASKFVLLRVFSVIETIFPKNLVKIITQECKKSTSGWRASLKMVAAFQIINQQSLFQKNGKYCSMHHPRRTLGSCRSTQIPWSWAIQWPKLLGLWQKANRSLGVIRRNLSKCPENVKEQAYLTLVRPQLEYVDVAHGIRTFKNR